MRLPVELALKDLRHDWQAAACFVAALVGVLAPLLVILALKNGVILTLLGRLVDDPSNRELIALGAGHHDAAFFADVAARDDVAFLLPATRRINAVANAVRHPAARELERAVTLIPSGPDDPLSPEAHVSEGRVVLTAQLAQTLEADPGDVLELRVER
ncbi:MAG: ABC transporter, partial [Pseudomonadota bacterium]